MFQKSTDYYIPLKKDIDAAVNCLCDCAVTMQSDMDF